MGIQDRMKENEEEMGRTQKNKATSYHLGRLKAQLAADCDLLARLNVMDYSLLLGVHFRKRCAGSNPRALAAEILRAEEA